MSSGYVVLCLRIYDELSLTVRKEWNLKFPPIPCLEPTSFACSHLLLLSGNGIFKNVFHKTSR